MNLTNYNNFKVSSNNLQNKIKGAKITIHKILSNNVFRRSSNSTAMTANHTYTNMANFKNLSSSPRENKESKENKEKDSYSCQTKLKRVLKEFGLQQYLRVIF